MKKKFKEVDEQLKADIKTLEYDFKTNNSNNELEFKKFKAENINLKKKALIIFINFTYRLFIQYSSIYKYK